MDLAERRGVGADAEEGRMPERHEPGVAAEHVPGEAEARPHQHQRHYQLVVGVGDGERDHREDRGEHEEGCERAERRHLTSVLVAKFVAMCGWLGTNFAI